MHAGKNARINARKNARRNARARTLARRAEGDLQFQWKLPILLVALHVNTTAASSPGWERTGGVFAGQVGESARESEARERERERREN